MQSSAPLLCLPSHIRRFYPFCCPSLHQTRLHPFARLTTFRPDKVTSPEPVEIKPRGCPPSTTAPPSHKSGSLRRSSATLLFPRVSLFTFPFPFGLCSHPLSFCPRFLPSWLSSSHARPIFILLVFCGVAIALVSSSGPLAGGSQPMAASTFVMILSILTLRVQGLPSSHLHSTYYQSATVESGSCSRICHRI